LKVRDPLLTGGPSLATAKDLVTLGAESSLLVTERLKLRDHWRGGLSVVEQRQ